MKSIGRFMPLFCMAILDPLSSYGHGFTMFLNDNQIDAETQNIPPLEEHLFTTIMFSSGGGYASDHGAVKAGSGSGFDLATDSFQLELQGKLWFSSGGPAAPAAEGVTLTGLNLNTSATVEITGEGVAPEYAGFPITGADSHEVLWTLPGSSIAPGAYGVSYRVSGLADDNPATPYETSDLLVLTLFTPGFSDSDNEAAMAIYRAATAVPGDFDGDGDVDGADFVVWQTNFPTAADADLSTGDADGDGDVDGADFVIWQTNFPTSNNSSLASVPEPIPLSLVACGILMLGLWNRRKVCSMLGFDRRDASAGRLSWRPMDVQHF